MCSLYLKNYVISLICIIILKYITVNYDSTLFFTTIIKRGGCHDYRGFNCVKYNKFS